MGLGAFDPQARLQDMDCEDVALHYPTAMLGVSDFLTTAPEDGRQLFQAEHLRHAVVASRRVAAVDHECVTGHE